MDTLRDYLRHMRRANLAESTIRIRRSKILHLAAWVEPRHVHQATADDIEALLDSRNLGPRSRYHWISHLHAYYTWATAYGHATTDPTAQVVRPRLPQLLPRPIPTGDLQMALDAAEPQMRAWLTLAAYAGLRCAEIARLEAGDLLHEDALIRVRGKGSRERLVPMHPVVGDAVRAAGARRGPLFRTDSGGTWTPARVSRHINGYLRGLGIEATAHQLRHWFGTQVHRETGDLRVTQELLGHASPTTTAVYAAWSPAKGRLAVDALPV